MILTGTDPDQIRPDFTNLEQARADRVNRSRRHAIDCILLAVVTPQEIAAEFIDLAIAHSRDI